MKEETGLIRTPVGTFELVEEFRNGWNPEAFKERYSDVLDKYDYVVGDWGYGQLRLRGFYDNSNRRVPLEQKIATLDEYLHEFCNFGCAYFVLRRVKTGLTALETAGFAESAETLVAANEAEWRQAKSEQTERRPRHPERDDQRPQRTNRLSPPQRRNDKERGEGRGERPSRGDKGGPNRGEGKGRPPRGGKRHDRNRERPVHTPGGRSGRDKPGARPPEADEPYRP